MGLSGQKPRIGFCLSLGWFMFECPRYCEIFGPGACAGGGTRIYIPTLRRAKIRARDMNINAERDELARKGLSERALVARLATLHGLSERQVWRILKQPRTSDNREAAS